MTNHFGDSQDRSLQNMNEDLFGNKVRPPKDKLELILKKIDFSSFSERLERVKYLDKIIPPNIGFLFSDEMHYLFTEAINSYINGQFVATILLSQSFIEHWLKDSIAKDKVKKFGRTTLDTILKAMKENNSANIELLNKIDRLRKIRNPFVHSKSFDNEYNVSKLAIKQRITPDEFLIKEARDSISLLFQVCITRFN